MKIQELPSKAQVKALTDYPALEALRDDLEQAILRIQTDLDNLDGVDDDWRRRASAALAVHHYTQRLVDRRLAELRGSRPKPGSPPPPPAVRRPLEACNVLTRAALEDLPEINPETLQSQDQCDEWFDRIGGYVAAIDADREDEIGRPASRRDEAFLAWTKRVLPALRTLRAQIQRRRGILSRTETRAFRATRDATRERLFIEAAQDLLPKEAYQTLWAQVDRREIEATLAAGGDGGSREGIRR